MTRRQSDEQTSPDGAGVNRELAPTRRRMAALRAGDVSLQSCRLPQPFPTHGCSRAAYFCLALSARRLSFCFSAPLHSLARCGDCICMPVCFFQPPADCMRTISAIFSALTTFWNRISLAAEDGPDSELSWERRWARSLYPHPVVGRPRSTDARLYIADAVDPAYPWEHHSPRGEHADLTRTPDGATRGARP